MKFRVRLKGTLTGNLGWSLGKATLKPFNLVSSRHIKYFLKVATTL